MKAIKPSYFDEIQQKAEDRWKQLEHDPELAAPWHQLFKQVQSPRHVISELLQNADDAEATEVSINITVGIFTFVHNGRDFSADDFAFVAKNLQLTIEPGAFLLTIGKLSQTIQLLP